MSDLLENFDEDERIEVVSNHRELFVRVPIAFLDSKLFDGKEKAVYTCLLRFLDVRLDNGTVFPSINRLCEMVGWAKGTVISVLDSLCEKKVIIRTRRGLNKTNTYEIVYNPALWKCETIEELKELGDRTKEELDKANEYIAYLESLGYKVDKPSSSDSSNNDVSDNKERGADDSKEVNENNDNAPVSCTKEVSPANSDDCSDFSSLSFESIDDVREFFYYERIECSDRAFLDSVFNIIYETLTTTKKYIRIKGENKPSSVVRSKLLKLNHMDIEYAISKYQSTTGRIYNQASYLLSILYCAKEQGELDVTNQVMYDFTHRNLRDD